SRVVHAPDRAGTALERFTPAVAAHGGFVHVTYRARSVIGGVPSDLVEMRYVGSADGGATSDRERRIGRRGRLDFAANTSGGLIAYSFVAAEVAGCDPKGADLEEVKKDQREIFFKLGSLDKTIQQVGTQPAAPAAAAAEPRKDYPKKAYTIPIAESPVKGP